MIVLKCGHWRGMWRR